LAHTWRVRSLGLDLSEANQTLYFVRWPEFNKSFPSRRSYGANASEVRDRAVWSLTLRRRNVAGKRIFLKESPCDGKPLRYCSQEIEVYHPSKPSNRFE